MHSQSQIPNPKSQIPAPRRAFTLMELLIVMMIMTLLAGLALSALAGATEAAREQRTRAIIAKIDQLIMDRYESYRTRAVPIRVAPGTNPRFAARQRLDGLRELMRMELPCCRGDVLENAVTLKALPALTRSYRRRVTNNWDSGYEGSECLYLILSTMHDGDKNALDYFGPEELGDVDNDGMKEILDAWGEPLIFLRWAPGFRSDAETPAVTHQTASAPDPFDPSKVDPRVNPSDGLPNYRGSSYSRDTDPTNDTFALTPLIFSTGRDRQNGTQLIPGYPSFKYSDFNTYAVSNPTTLSPPNDPYWCNNPPVGTILDASLAADDITNHFVQTP